MTGLGNLYGKFYEEMSLGRRTPFYDFIPFETALAFAEGNPVDTHGEYLYKHTFQQAVARLDWDYKHEYFEDSAEVRFLSSCRFKNAAPTLIDGFVTFDEPCPYGDPYSTMLPDETKTKLKEILLNPKLKGLWDKKWEETQYRVASDWAQDKARRTNPVEEDMSDTWAELGIDIDELISKCVENSDKWREQINLRPEEGSLFDQVKKAIDNGQFVEEGLLQAFKKTYPNL
jgi:hypothetical protein